MNIARYPGLVGLLALLLLGCQADAPEASNASDATRPRYRVEGLQRLTTGPQGEPLLRLTVARGDYLDDRSLRATQLTAEGLDGELKPWVLQSPSATVPPQAKRILLDAPVTGSGKLPSGEPVTLRGGNTWVALDSRRMGSEAPVTLQSPRRQLTAKSWQADFTGRNLVLQHVHMQLPASTFARR